ncbi:2Fe-2S iron-sulfur cluster binding domain-containing protein [Scytonema sp. UIC 10036]|uniref:2Fe-2S iron-sulfur cluster-binding protein n=1 Tax=Scytonema sp. UIC 10036 TaxID=2304196 RepID=UPI0012DAE392|nr:2Fe-2S iron-sulfur cluster-binding protein [Scytonema sp. UIC 10036]MUG97657.1 2Fe-2S iron-sulfur cluster binding domain-containing protein [Scytonema sp. UIC 10036]
MKAYKITLVNRNNFTLEVTGDRYILDAVEAAGLRLPVGCRYGACITCAARLIEGEVEQCQAIALKPAQEAMGYVLLCIAYPRSDCKFEVGVESQYKLYVNPFKGFRQ